MLPTCLEDGLEAVAVVLQEGDTIRSFSAIDVSERTGLPIHRVRQALRLLQDLDLAGRLGRRERHGVRWSTQFYYYWVGDSRWGWRPREELAGLDVVLKAFGVSPEQFSRALLLWWPRDDSK